jgi:hypothetical protein
VPSAANAQKWNFFQPWSVKFVSFMESLSVFALGDTIYAYLGINSQFGWIK